MAVDETILIADQYACWHTTTGRSSGADPRRVARDLRMVSNVLAPRQQCIALLDAEDSQGLGAYCDADYDILVMNGDRKRKLVTFIGHMQETLRMAPPRNLILMTTDPAFVRLCESATELPQVSLAVWGPASDTPPELAQSVYNFRPLEDLLPGARSATVDIRLDFENLYLGLLKLGWRRDIRAMIQAVRDQVTEFGDVVSISAYGDWEWLAERDEPGIQRELFRAGVETRYQTNIHGKNSSDMVIARDIQSMVELAANRGVIPDVVVLGTCDRDFRPLLQLAQERRRRIVLLTLKRGLSELLREAASQDIRYLDERLGLLPRKTPAPMDNRKRDYLADGTVLAEIWFRRHDLVWAGSDALADVTGSSSAGRRWLQDAVADGILEARVRSMDDPRLDLQEVRLVPGHPLVETVRYLLDWVPKRIRYSLQTKGMPYVDTKYLFNGMRMEAPCQYWDVGQTRGDAERWLDRLAGARVIERKDRPHPATPSKVITTWICPKNGTCPETE